MRPAGYNLHMKSEEIPSPPAAPRARAVGSLRAMTKVLAGLTDWLPQRYGHGLQLTASSDHASAPQATGLLRGLSKVIGRAKERALAPFEALASFARSLVGQTVGRFFGQQARQREEAEQEERERQPEQLRRQMARNREIERVRQMAGQVAEARRQEHEAARR